MPIGLIGEDADLTYAYDYLGAGPETLAKLADGSHPFLKRLEGAERPMLILGQAALARPDGAAVLALAAKAATAIGAIKPEVGWNGFNVLHTCRRTRRPASTSASFPAKAASTSKASSMRQRRGKSRSSICSAPTRSTWSGWAAPSSSIRAAMATRGAHRADVILPGAAYTEKDAIYVNTEGRAQMTARAVFPPGDAREDWKILRALSACSASLCRSTSTQALRAKMFAAHPHLALLDQIDPADSAAIERLAKQPAKPGKERFGHAIDDFYLTNPIARASAIMASLSALHAAPDKATGTDG